MKTKKILLIITLSLIFLLFLFASAGIINVHLYRSNMTQSSSSNWNNSFSNVGFSIDGSNDSLKAISNTPVSFVVVYKSKQIGDIHAINPVIVDISDMKLRSIWLPLYKRKSYNYNVSCNDIRGINTASATGRFFIKGEVEINGKLNIIGLCSAKHARNMIVDSAMQQVYTEMKKNNK